MARTSDPSPAPKRRFGRRRKAAAGEPSTWENFTKTVAIIRRNDRRALPYGIGAGVLVLAVLLGIGFAIGHWTTFLVVGLVLGLLGGMNTFLFRGRKAVYAEVEGQKGVALHVVRQMRGDWKITEAVQFNRSQDFVHRVVGRPGIVLIAEGRPQAARDMMITEARRVRRVAADAPLHEVVVGTGVGEVPLGKLSNHLTRLPRKLGKDQVRSLDVKLKAVGNTNIGLPKGPMPTHVKRPKVR